MKSFVVIRKQYGDFDVLIETAIASSRYESVAKAHAQKLMEKRTSKELPSMGEAGVEYEVKTVIDLDGPKHDNRSQEK